MAAAVRRIRKSQAQAQEACVHSCPVCRPHLNLLLGFHFDPSAKNAATRKHKGVWPVLVDHSEFGIAVEGCAGDRLPHLITMVRSMNQRLDVDHTDCDMRCGLTFQRRTKQANSAAERLTSCIMQCP